MAQITRGSVDVTNGSQIITGTGTLFQTDAADNGDLFVRSGDNVAYAIASVDSETQITLAANYAGATGSSVNYAITVDFTPNFGLPLPQTGDIGVSAQLRDAFTEIDLQLLATAGVTTFNGMTDTDFTGLNNNDIAVFNQISGNWEPQSQATGSGLFNVEEDTSPTLGGTLDTDGHSIISQSGIDIIINPGGSGRVILDGTEYPGDTGNSGQVLTTNGAGVSSWEDAPLIEEINWFIESPVTKTMTVIQSAAYTRTIDRIVLQTSVGSAGWSMEIGGTPITWNGSTVFGTSEVDRNSTGSFTVALGDKVTLIFNSVNEDVADLGITIYTTRT